MSSPSRLIFYVDGFNLYFGLREAGLRRCFWLNPCQLAKSLLKPNQTLVCVKYFTSMISDDPANPGKADRQKTFLEAINTLPDLHIYYGQYQVNPRRCDSCKTVSRIQSEKMTDVNIAVELMSDAFQDAFDVAMIVSADSDLVPPVRAVRTLFPKNKTVLAFPPSRRGKALAKAAHASFQIGRANLMASQFPDIVIRQDGFKLVRPATWYF